MQIAIKPIDVWLFRDGKPFTAGEDHIAESTFPPSPFTLQGAIRTKILADKGVLSQFASQEKPDPDVGYSDNFGNLRLCGPLLMYRKNNEWERLIPMPADVVKAGEHYKLLRPNSNLPFMTNLPNYLQLLWAQTPERFKEAKAWLPESEWMRYLQGQAPEKVVKQEDLYTLEPRFGIAIDRAKGTTQEAMLYQSRFIRLKDETALWAEIDGVSLSERGFLRFGGEGRAAIYEALSKQLPPLSQFNTAVHDVKRFKVVLVTPAWFSGGWQPKGGDWSKIFGSQVRLVAAAIPQPLLLGGFDIAKGIPKPMRAFVPAGAVYFFEADEPIQIPDNFCFTETPEDVRLQNNGKNAWGEIGFGKVLIGRW